MQELRGAVAEAHSQISVRARGTLKKREGRIVGASRVKYTTRTLPIESTNQAPRDPQRLKCQSGSLHGSDLSPLLMLRLYRLVFLWDTYQ